MEKFLIIFFALTVMAALSNDMLIGIFSGVLGVLVSLIGAYDISKGGNGEFRLMFALHGALSRQAAFRCCRC